VAAPTIFTYSATKFAILGSPNLRGELAAQYRIALLPSLTDTDRCENYSGFDGGSHNSSVAGTHLDCMRNHLESWEINKVFISGSHLSKAWRRFY